METKYFENDGFVGKKVTDANEAIKLFNAGMDVRDQQGNDFLWWEDADSEPSESEIVSRIMDYFDNESYVYVGFELTKDRVVPIKSTQLDCDFYVGQTVYFMYKGNITSGKVISIQRATNGRFADIIGSQLRTLRSYADSLSSVKSAMGFVDYLDYAEDYIHPNCACIKTYDGSFVVRPIDKIFITKEALANDLLKNAK